MTRTNARRLALAAAVAMLGPIAVGVQAQEAINTDSALAPGEGRLLVRTQIRYHEAGDDPSPLDREVENIRLATTLVYGATENFTAIVNFPYDFREVDVGATGRTIDDNGLSDVTALLKYRLHRNDFGVGSSERISLLGGLEIRSGETGFTSDSYDPIIGAVYTRYVNRHGFNADALYKFNTGGEDDRLRYDVAYTYRLLPTTYGEESNLGFFGVAELNGLYDTNGDHELFLSPGLQLAWARVALEASVQIPVWQDLDNRLERDFVAVFGVKLLF